MSFDRLEKGIPGFLPLHPRKSRRTIAAID
jgi:hypothetical protein